ncbi:MAG: hypothetical protein ACXVBW_12740, partial [Bdellovibrionota bacterium]
MSTTRWFLLPLLLVSSAASADSSGSQVFKFPDPADPGYSPALVLKSASGQPIAGSSDQEKLRNWVAETFERAVRVYVGGSAQLAVDTGVGLAGGGEEIKGLYQGYEPNVLQPELSRSTKVVYLDFDNVNARCGIANLDNKWFKKRGGGYEESVSADGLVSNHRPECQADPSKKIMPEIALLNGQVINASMKLMDKMVADLKQGKLVTAD